VARSVAQGQLSKPDYTAVPSAVFSNPEIATVVRPGLTHYTCFVLIYDTASAQGGRTAREELLLMMCFLLHPVHDCGPPCKATAKPGLKHSRTNARSRPLPASASRPSQPGLLRSFHGALATRWVLAQGLLCS
jgi:hypothetical protein